MTWLRSRRCSCWLLAAFLGGAAATWAQDSTAEDPAPARLPAPATVAVPAPPPGELARCKALIDAGQFAAARARLQPLVDVHPRWAKAVGLLALTYFKEHRFEVAAPLFERALATDPEEVAAMPPYGWTLQALGRLEEAKVIFERLLARLPHYPSGHAALGQIALDQHDLPAARRHLETAERLATEQGDLQLAVRVRRQIDALAPVPPKTAETPSQAASSFDFTVVPGAAGIDLEMTSGSKPSREILEVNGGGVALFDYDRDGDLDVFLANGATMTAPDAGPGSRLYANSGNGTFEDVTTRVGIVLRRWAMGVAVGDVDGDGWEDLYVTCYGPNVLLRNEAGPDGGRHFRDVSAEAGVADPSWSSSATFADLDADGDLDLFVVNYLEFDPADPPDRFGKAYRGVPVMGGPLGTRAQPDTLYENLGDGRFRDISAAAGLRATDGSDSERSDYGLGVRVLDFDSDGRPDIFIGNDSTPDQLYRNLGGLRFEEVGASAGLATNGGGTPQATMGIGQADIDGNGLPDLLVTVFSDDANTLHLNRGDGLFRDGSAQYGVAAPSRPLLGWGCGFYDFDLDGDEDLLISNGHVYPEMDNPQVSGSNGGQAQRILLLERRGARFEAATCGGAWCAQPVHGRATAFGDLDGDLDVDVVVTTLNGPVLFLRNNTPPRRSLVVRLNDPPPNRHAVGSLVEVESALGIQRRWIGGGSFQSADAPEAYFGFGDLPADTTVTVRVRGLDGSQREWRGVALDQLFGPSGVTAP